MLLARFVCALLFFSLAHAASPSWIVAAKHLIGESDEVRNKAIAELRALPDLDDLLKREVQSDNRPYALDVIVALAKESLLPELFEAMIDDSDGIVSMAINGLLTPKNKKKIAQAYIKQIEEYMNGVSPGNLVAMLEALGRMQSYLKPPTLVQLMQSPSIEVRSSILNYLRTLNRKDKHPVPLEILKMALSAEQPYQIRLQAANFIGETHLPRHTAKDFHDLKSELEQCRQDRHPMVREVCSKISFKIRKG